MCEKVCNGMYVAVFIGYVNSCRLIEHVNKSLNFTCLCPFWFIYDCKTRICWPSRMYCGGHVLCVHTICWHSDAPNRGSLHWPVFMLCLQWKGVVEETRICISDLVKKPDLLTTVFPFAYTKYQTQDLLVESQCSSF